ncbi:uncharacterized protein TRAVEDRAFT_68517 [Trametes versicolor FP-101664 SS1]|uniref:uncharacterized protein n=1 Tax=Trametes versicolor (strain FP-101664) TaxID=717944 RepID=UPI000462423B|nr:uncharacterized protein TRAVEDRAFT_68517 [Trametes versicolor FP-101664 SS1]EIW64790.1 hypothetical protein TRAVEDRAFT_68517 [Trametes versicolor FP-101664 SS1]
MPPRRKIYEEESEDEEVASEAQSEVMEDELDMDVDDDEQGEADDVDVVGDIEHDDEAVVDDNDVVEEDIEDELADDVSETEPEVAAPTRLKIKLKLPQNAGPSSAATRSSAHNTPSRASRRNVPRGSDIESEDDDDEDDDEGSTRSASEATTGAGSRALTARQAVLRNVVDSSHVSLAEAPNPRKKKPLTEIEIALKREETARKRRNLTEKKLEDEKAETINRLLKKQSRARGKRNALATAEDKPAPGDNALGEGEEEDIVDTPALVPTMYRWVSRAQPLPKAGEEGEGSVPPTERTSVISFSIPVAALPPTDAAGDNAMQVDNPPPRLPPSSPPHCDVQGCSEFRKYRLVRDFHKGACGMSHLKVLEAQTV